MSRGTYVRRRRQRLLRRALRLIARRSACTAGDVSAWLRVPAYEAYRLLWDLESAGSIRQDLSTYPRLWMLDANVRRAA